MVWRTRLHEFDCRANQRSMFIRSLRKARTKSSACTRNRRSDYFGLRYSQVSETLKKAVEGSEAGAQMATASEAVKMRFRESFGGGQTCQQQNLKNLRKS